MVLSCFVQKRSNSLANRDVAKSDGRWIGVPTAREERAARRTYPDVRRTIRLTCRSSREAVPTAPRSRTWESRRGPFSWLTIRACAGAMTRVGVRPAASLALLRTDRADLLRAANRQPRTAATSRIAACSILARNLEQRRQMATKSKSFQRAAERPCEWNAALDSVAHPARLADGRDVVIRAATRRDLAGIIDFFERLNAESRSSRFFSPQPRLRRAMIQRIRDGRAGRAGSLLGTGAAGRFLRHRAQHGRRWQLGPPAAP